MQVHNYFHKHRTNIEKEYSRRRNSLEMRFDMGQKELNTDPKPDNYLAHYDFFFVKSFNHKLKKKADQQNCD